MCVLCSNKRAEITLRTNQYYLSFYLKYDSYLADQQHRVQRSSILWLLRYQAGVTTLLYMLT
jgi:hypothetical protein